MKSDFLKIFTICLAIFFAAQLFAAETNSISSSAATNDIANGYLQLQAQLHATQLQIEQSREENVVLSQSNLDAMNLRIQQLEQTLATQRAGDLDMARRSQQLTTYLVAMIGLAGLAVLLLVGYFQWRALSQLTEITSRHSAALAAAQGVHQLAAPGRATVEVSNARLLDIVGQLEKKIYELETGGRLLAQPAAAANPLAEGQKFLDAGEFQRALDIFERFLASQPQNAEALAKKASALEKLGRVDESLAICDAAIAANGSLVVAYLQKGGLLNRLGRYDEALKCYEQAMLVQDKKTAKV
jgi:tetratricopeptide (TPR) repeat protein